MAIERAKRTIEVWDRCECGRLLTSIAEGERGTCAGCWMKSMPADTKRSLNKLIGAAFRPTSDKEKDALIGDAMENLNRDEKNQG